MPRRRDLSSIAAFAAALFFLVSFVSAALLLSRAEEETRRMSESTATLLSASALATLDLPAPPTTREETLERVHTRWSAFGEPASSAYLCAVDGQGTVLLHTRDAEREGRSMAGGVVEIDGHRTTIGALVASGKPWSGVSILRSGERQFLVAHPNEALRGYIIIHAPFDSTARGTARWLLPLLGVAAALFAAFAWQMRSKRATLAEEAQARSGAEFHNLAESLPQIIYLKDDVTGRFLYVNGATERVLGVPREKVLSDAAGMARNLLHPDDVPSVLPRLAEPSRGISALEYRVVLPDGRIRHMRHTRVPVIVNGRPTDRSAGSIEDVTVERRASDARASLSSLIVASPDPIAVLRNGIISWANPAAGEALGIPAAELTGKNLFDLIHPDDRPRVEATISALVPGAPTPSLEARVIRANGETLDAEVRGVLVELDGEAAVLVIGRDITERKRMATQIGLQDRLASVGALAAGVAHEINNPLTWVIANLSTLLRDIEGAGSSLSPGLLENLRAQLDDASQGATRVKEIVRDLRSFARTDEECLSVIDIEDAIDLALNMCSNEIKYRAKLERERSSDATVKANEGKLSQIFLNLLVNAVQAIPEGQAAKNWIRVRTTVEDAAVVVEIADSGAGIPREVVAKIFDPFFTTKPAGDGSGLGLAISRSIVQSLGGTITVESVPGNGTTFRVRLPHAARQAAKAAAGQPETAAPRARILVIDDEALIAAAIRSLLPEHEVIGETSARRARERITAGERFDLVLCDLVMPEETGTDFDAWIRANAPGFVARTRYMTAGAFTRETREFAARLGVNIIHKPFDGARLRQIVASTVALPAA